MSRLIDMTGDRYGKLTVLRRASNTPDGQARWWCRCDCGTEKAIRGAELRKRQRSCGCAQQEGSARARRTHGKSRTALHRLWRNMINRCERPETHNYNRYGGRGITVCAEWRSDAKAFIDWCLSNGWQPHLQLDRRDNDKGYCPANCRFVTRLENMRNRGSRRTVGATQC